MPDHGVLLGEAFAALGALVDLLKMGTGDVGLEAVLLGEEAPAELAFVHPRRAVELFFGLHVGVGEGDVGLYS